MGNDEYLVSVSIVDQRFDGREFLEKMRSKKIMFVGDSLSRNQWQSLTCLLHSAVPDAKYNISRDYAVQLMLDRNVFLVDVVRLKIGRILILDSIVGGKLWKDIGMLIFNT